MVSHDIRCYMQVPKLITPPKQYPNNTHRDLDPRGAFVLQTPGGPTYVWRGEHCPDAYMEAAHRAAAHLQKFEGAGPTLEVQQGGLTGAWCTQAADVCFMTGAVGVDGDPPR